MSATRKRLFIKTYGCQMNVYDSQRMRDVLAPLGYEAADTPEGADLVVLNTCHIREKASEKVYSELGRMRVLKTAREEAGGAMMIAVAGCVAQAEGAEIMARAPVVDLVVGPQSYHQLPELIARAARARGEALQTEFEPEAKFDALPAPHADGPTAFVTVQEGCDKFCTFCVVPYTRGAEWSRAADQIAAEVRALAAQGVREITLLGQNVNAYRGAPPSGREADGPWGLARLLRHLALIGGVERLRYTTSHPRDMDSELIAAHRDLPCLMPYLHLPVQSGSDRILKAMNRRHSFAEYADIIGRVREARPDIAISGDFIVGFPGESDTDFEATLQAARDIDYASAFSFKYSRRPGTPGAAMPGQVSEAEKDARLQALQPLLEDQRLAFNAAQAGRTLPILFESAGKHKGQLVGRSPYLQSVYCEGPERLIGEIAPVVIRKATRGGLSGELAPAKAGAA